MSHLIQTITIESVKRCIKKGLGSYTNDYAGWRTESVLQGGITEPTEDTWNYVTGDEESDILRFGLSCINSVDLQFDVTGGGTGGTADIEIFLYGQGGESSIDNFVFAGTVNFPDGTTNCSIDTSAVGACGLILEIAIAGTDIEIDFSITDVT